MMHRMTGLGLPNVYLSSGFSVEGSGSKETVSYRDLDGLYVAIARAVANRAAPLTASEFRFLRRRLGMSQIQAGALVGKTDQAVAKWEKESNGIPLADGRLVRLAWLSRFKPRDLRKAVERMVRSNDYVAADYCFSFNGSEWVDDAERRVFIPLVDAAGREARAVIGRVQSSAYTLPTSKSPVAHTQESRGMT